VCLVPVPPNACRVDPDADGVRDEKIDGFRLSECEWLDGK
jgi:hypothetical protein